MQTTSQHPDPQAERQKFITAFNKTMKFKSSNTNVVSVDENGLMNAHDKGTAKVTISTTDGSKKNLVVDVVVK